MRRPDEVQAAPALPDQLAHHGHGKAGGQPAAEGHDGAVGDQGRGVGEGGSFVTWWLQAHDDPPELLMADRPGVPGREQHGVVDGRERRGVAEVKRGEVVDGEAGVQRGRQHVDSLRGALGTGHLRAEQPAIRRVHQPDVQRGAARVVFRPRPGYDVGGDRGQAGRRGLGQAEAGSRHLKAEHLDHRGADDAGE